MERVRIFNRAVTGSKALISVFLIGLIVPAYKSQSANFSTSQSQVAGGSSVASIVQASYADVVSRVAPAVVTVRSTERAREARQFPFLDDPFFRDFFGERLPFQQEPPQRIQGIGSGVIVSADGYVLTNHHVVDGAVEIKVETNDDRTFTAKLVGSDAPSDLAVLKIDARDMPVLSLGDSDKVRVGDVVLAIGNPLGIGQTVTSGIISAKGRATGLSDGSFEDFLQTDAAINRGNSGGALVNATGELIGINSQILSPSGGNIGIGFAIPSNMARAVMDQLRKTGTVRRGMIGVTIQSLNADLAQSLNLPSARGAIITSVQRSGPADKAGIRREDVITRFNGQPIGDSNNLRNLIASAAPGSEASLTLMRDGREQNVKIILGELPARARQDNDSGSPEPSQSADKFGLTLQPLTPDLASRLGLGVDEQGVVVSAVDPAGAAADAGIIRGDVIQEVNRQPVRTPRDFNVAIARSGSKPALVLINRRGTVIYLTLRQN